MKTKELNQIELTRVSSDVSGNPRHVCHFLNLVNEGDDITAGPGLNHLTNLYQIALNKAKSIGGRKFHNKQYGGGIVFQSYSNDNTIKLIQELKEVNINFTKEWANFEADFKKVKKAITKYFKTHKFNWFPGEGRLLHFNVNTFNEIDAFLGLAYTSTGAYAGLWVCNGGYLMANETHHFTGFMLNELGEVVAMVEDENEKAIFINLSNY